MGTRFMCTQESCIHDAIKQQIVDNTERDTKLILRTLRNTSRVAKNAVSSEVVDIEARGGATIDDLRHLVAGKRGKSVYDAGDPEAGIWSAGQVQGLIHDVPTVAELVSRIIGEAESIIAGRLGGMTAATAAAAE